MILGRTLALVTARGGSKGLPGKNLRPLLGRPLIAWTIEAARAVPELRADDIIVSTDAPDIAAAARRAGARVPFIRPALLAADDASSLAVALHALDWCAAHDGVVYDTLLLLQPTSPLRTGAHLRDALACYAASDADALMSVTDAIESPFHMYVRDATGALMPVLPPSQRPHRRQDLPSCWVENGAVYITNVAALRETGRFTGTRCVPFEMSRDASVDIDSLEDFHRAEALIRRDRVA